jgi:deoxyribodipyrimidine photo-lyase
LESRINIFWFRRDLRFDDNAGLYNALNAASPVLPLFIFDTDILNKLDSKNDRRVDFIHRSLADLDQQLKKLGSSLLVLHGNPNDVWKKILRQYKIESVFTNHDYEPDAIKRDADITKLLQQKGITFNSFKDQVIFEKNEVVKPDGKPYTIFTPYSKVWLSKFSPAELRDYSIKKLKDNFFRFTSSMPTLESIGFSKTDVTFPSAEINQDIIQKYDSTRDYPSIEGTSRLGVHLRFGTVSIRKLVRIAYELNSTFLKELIWREFFMMILYHFPYSAAASFKPQYDRIKWLNSETDFEAWCSGKTCYPIVDAGMRELNSTGFMHNRVRMITASFLTKHLLIDWRWGERYFADKLLDYELSSNAGNWQWAAGTGCDAAPYFRVFNPAIQMKKFDPDLEYVKKWVPEYSDPSAYPPPIVDHAFARSRALSAYKKALGK